MSEDLKLPQHVLLKEEPEEEGEDQQTGQVAQQASQSTSASSTLYEKQAQTAQNQGNNDNNNNVEITPYVNNNNIMQGSTTASSQVVMLSIKQLSGETVQIPYNDQVKAMSISNLKRQAFPVQSAQGYNIRFIYRGRLLGEGECLNNLQFIDQPIIHAQLNQPILLQDQQSNNTSEGQQQQQQQGQIAVEMQNNNNNNNVQLASSNNDNNSIQVQLQEPLNQQVLLAVNQPTVSIQTIPLEDEGTTCDFWFGLFLVLFLDLVGMIIVFCCQYSKNARKGAVIAFVIRCVLNLLFYNGEDTGDSRDR